MLLTTGHVTGFKVHAYRGQNSGSIGTSHFTISLQYGVAHVHMSLERVWPV